MKRIMMGSLGLALCFAGSALAQQTIPGPNTAQMEPATQPTQRTMPSQGSTAAAWSNPPLMRLGSVVGPVRDTRPGSTGQFLAPTPLTPRALKGRNAPSGQVR